MNIAFCYDSVIPERGGCETYIADLARRLVKEGHEVHLYASRWEESALPKEMVFHKLPPSKTIRFLKPWQFSQRCEKALAENKHDISMGFNKTWGQEVLYPLGGLHSASADHNVRKHASVLVRMGAWLAQRLNPVNWTYAQIERKQYRSAHLPTVVANSEMVRGHFRTYLDYPEDRLFVVRNSIDPDRFPQEQRLAIHQRQREAWKLSPSDIVAVFIARNYKLKGLAPLLKAVRTLIHEQVFSNRSWFQLVVAGSSKNDEYERLARKLDIADRVRFVGSCADISEAFFTADFLVHPTFYDPCSLVVLEALACGVPVITTRYNGAAELMHPPQEGFVINDPHNDVELSTAMGELLDHDKRAACSKAARESATDWTFEQHYQQLMRVFEDVVRRKQAA